MACPRRGICTENNSTGGRGRTHGLERFQQLAARRHARGRQHRCGKRRDRPLRLSRTVDMAVPKAELVSIYELSSTAGPSDRGRPCSSGRTRLSCSLILPGRGGRPGPGGPDADAADGDGAGGRAGRERDSVLTEWEHNTQSFLNAVNVLIGGRCISVPGSLMI